MEQKKNLDELANFWNKTVKETYGPNSIERWNVSISSVNKADDGTYVVIGKRNRLF